MNVKVANMRRKRKSRERDRMPDPITRAFVDNLLQISGKKPTQLAREPGIAPSTLTRYLRGDHGYELSMTTLRKLSAAAGLTNPLDSRGVRKVAVVGIAIGGAVVLAPEGNSHVDAPAGHDPDTLWAFKIEDYSFPPFKPGWIVFVDRTERPLDGLNDTLCLVKVEGEEPWLLRNILVTNEPGVVDLMTYIGGELRRNVRLETAYLVASISQPIPE
jgi:transcriptional regulator with XRE-family HTH domain